MGKFGKFTLKLLRELQDLPTLDKDEMDKIVGGKKSKDDSWNNGCGGITPQ